jgi:Flp pilus assembly protein TadB
MHTPLLAVSTLGIILIVLAALVAIALLLGLLGIRARNRRQAGSYADNVAQADSALEQARALDRGWQREVMEATARGALERERPGWSYADLHLVLVDDKPGVQEDRAHFVAVGEGGEEARVVLGRQDGDWVAESVE